MLDNWNGELQELVIIGKSRLGNCNNVGDKLGFMKKKSCLLWTSVSCNINAEYAPEYPQMDNLESN